MCKRLRGWQKTFYLWVNLGYNIYSFYVAGKLGSLETVAQSVCVSKMITWPQGHVPLAPLDASLYQDFLFRLSATLPCANDHKPRSPLQTCGCVWARKKASSPDPISCSIREIFHCNVETRLEWKKAKKKNKTKQTPPQVAKTAERRRGKQPAADCISGAVFWDL